MVAQERKMPGIPVIGKADVYYGRLISQAEQQGDAHLRAAAKASRYITLGLNPHIPWAQKLRYFTHALSHHCTHPSDDPAVKEYYARLADLVRQHCGAEALRLASAEDDMYAARAALGQERATIEEDAEVFFGTVLGNADQCPAYFNDVDWQQLKLIRDQWI